jgi:hypothetical protein
MCASLVLLLVVATPIEAAPTEAPQTVAAFSKAALVGMQLGALHGFQRGEIPQSTFECIQRYDESIFDATVSTLLAEKLSEEEILAAEDFFSSPTGIKYRRKGIMGIYVAVGEVPPEPAPTLSDADFKEVERFSRTSAGRKIILENIMQSGNSREVVTARVHQLLSRCVEE